MPTVIQLARSDRSRGRGQLGAVKGGHGVWCRSGRHVRRLFRTLRDAFGAEHPVGKRIEFETNDLGVLTWLTLLGHA